MIDTLSKFISQPTGSTLGFAGIAIIYISTAIFDKKSKGRGRIAKTAYIIAGLFFGYLAYRCQQIGTIRNVDAGIVLAYLGIGAGLISSGWAAQDNSKILSGVVFGIGMLFEIFGLILIRTVGII
jgi:hypothetical protein